MKRKTIDEITKAYHELVKSEKEQGVQPNRVNCYTCACGNVFKTIDINKGVTPFFKACDICDGLAKSSFYKDIDPELKPIGEWFRPTLKECIEMRESESDMLEHILRGGLDYRKIKQ